MIPETKIKKRLNETYFFEDMKEYDETDIDCSPHSFFRFSETQRKTFNCDFVKSFLLGKKPILVGIQFNGRYAVFYDHENNRVLKVILTFIVNRITVITFYVIEKHQLPKV